MFDRPTPSVHHLRKTHQWQSNCTRLTLPSSYLTGKKGLQFSQNVITKNIILIAQMKLIYLFPFFWIVTIIQISSCRSWSPGPAQCRFWENPQTQACEQRGQLLAPSGQQLVFVLGWPAGGLDTPQLQDTACRYNQCSQLQVRHG